MKTLKLFAITLCITFISCIPSLHPIYTENNRILDKRLEGHWVNEDIKIQAGQLDIQIDGMGTEDLKDIEAQIESENDLFGLDEVASWRFERAADITYDKIMDSGASVKVSLEDQLSETHDTNLLQKGFSVTEIELKPYYILEYKNLEDEEPVAEKVKVNLTTIKGETYIDFQTLPEIREASRFSINLIPAHTFAKLEFADGDMYIKSFDSRYIEKLIKEKRVKLKHENVDDVILLTASTEELRAFIEKYGQEEELFLDREKLVKI